MIVKNKKNNEIYEVKSIYGDVAWCKPIHPEAIKKYKETGIPVLIEEIEVMMEEETDIFNILFNNED